jgi:hypothetical protein
MKVMIEIELKGSHETFKQLAASEPSKAGAMLDPELKEFNNSLMGRGMDPMGRFEEQIVREYLGFKVAAVELQRET